MLTAFDGKTIRGVIWLELWVEECVGNILSIEGALGLGPRLVFLGIIHKELRGLLVIHAFEYFIGHFLKHFFERGQVSWIRRLFSCHVSSDDTECVVDRFNVPIAFTILLLCMFVYYTRAN